MKLKNCKDQWRENVEENRAEKIEMLRKSIIEICIRSIAEADAIASVDGYDENYVLELIARTLLNYAKSNQCN